MLMVVDESSVNRINGKRMRAEEVGVRRGFVVEKENEKLCAGVVIVPAFSAAIASALEEIGCACSDESMVRLTATPTSAKSG